MKLTGIMTSMALVALASAATADPWESVFPGGETVCANGEEYVFHVRKASSEKLMIYFNGGGACWNAHMCDPANSSNDMDSGMIYRTQPTDEYGNDPRSMDGAFALDNPDNPFAEWSQIFVVYCTGDVHMGDTVHEYTREDGSNMPINHVGRTNSAAAMDYAVANFPDADTVFVSGGSAGAIASHFYAADAATRFPEAEIIHFAGGGGGYRPPVAQTEIWNTWGTFESMPDWWDTDRFNARNTRLGDLIYPAAEAFPHIRYHRYDTAYDHAQTTFHVFLGFPTLLHENVKQNNADLSQDIPFYRSFVGSGEFHTILRYDEVYTREVHGARALDWIRDIAEGNPVVDVTCGNSAQCR